MGICSFENWSLWRNISLADNPRLLMREFMRAVAVARTSGVMPVRLGLIFNSSFSSSQMVCSVTGFFVDVLDPANFK